MLQKLALARASLHRPPLVLLDEPTAALDVPSAAAVRDHLESLVAQEGVTVFLATHNMAEAERLCSRVAVIGEGRLVALGHPDELRAQAGGPRVEIVGRGLNEFVLSLLRKRAEVISARRENQYVAVDLREGSEAASLVSLLVGVGVQVDEVRRGKASLEDVSITLMEEER